MKSNQEIFVEFSDPELPANKWLGSARYFQQKGISVRAISELKDNRTNLQNAIDINRHQILEGKSDLADHFAMFEPKLVERSLRFEEGFMSSQVTFDAAAVAIGRADRFTSAKKLARRFYLKSPIIFSFINEKPYSITASKRANKFSIRDDEVSSYKYSGQVFSSIVFSVDKELSDSVDGDVARIVYGGSAEFISRRSLNVLQIYVVARLIEKLLFILVGDHTGPLQVDIRGRSKKEKICEIDCTSPLYKKYTVTPGLDRCWTLSKLSLDFGSLVDMALARYNTIETAVELIIDARAEEMPQSRFFKLVRALENIGRNLLPKGLEQAPKELNAVRSMLSNDPELANFFEKRINPIFQRPNSLGYTIDFAKEFFPFWPITELDKKDVTRLRGIEAHARAHQFSPEETSLMSSYSEIIDFICRAFLLKYLGVEYDVLIRGIMFPSRFAWFSNSSVDT